MKPRLLFLAAALAPALAFAQSDLDEALGGFDDAPATDPALDDALSGFDSAAAVAEPAPTTEPPSRWRVGGDALLSGAWNYEREAPSAGEADWRGLSRMRARLNMRLDGDVAKNWEARATGYAFHDLAYGINGRDQYRSETLDSLESELELGEAWLRGKLDRSLDLKVGRQIVVWGKSDNLRVTDVLNPLDNREPGMTDIEDLRLPVTMTRLDYYAGPWNLTALALHEVRFNKNPPYGGDFYVVPTAPQAELTPEGTEYAAALNGIFSGWDLSFYASDLYDDQARLVSTPSPQLRHARIGMLGAAANIAVGDWLLKGELARFRGLEYRSLPGQDFIRTDLLLGVEYSGLRDASVSLEIVNRHVQDHVAALNAEGVPQDETQAALRYTGDYLHARLHLTAVASLFSAGGGGFSRWQAKYDLRDALSLTGGVVLYHDGERFPFAPLADHDRLFAELKYSF